MGVMRSGGGGKLIGLSLSDLKYSKAYELVGGLSKMGAGAGADGQGGSANKFDEVTGALSLLNVDAAKFPEVTALLDQTGMKSYLKEVENQHLQREMERERARKL